MQCFASDRNTILLFFNLFTLLYILLLLCPVFTSLDCKAIPCPAIEIDCLLFYFEYTCNMLEKFTAQCRSILFTFCCSCTSPALRLELKIWLTESLEGEAKRVLHLGTRSGGGKEGRREYKNYSRQFTPLFKVELGSQNLLTRLSCFKRFAKMRGWQVVLHHPFC